MTRLLFVAAILVSACSAPAAERASPHDKATISLAAHPLLIEYGRPYLKGRKAVGGALVPFGEVWRLGADEATKLTTPVDLVIGDLKVPAGSYSFFVIADSEFWTLIVNKTADQWGAFSYDKATDLGRTRMTLSKPPAPAEQFTISFTPVDDKSATLRFAWENTVASVPVKLP